MRSTERVGAAACAGCAGRVRPGRRRPTGRRGRRAGRPAGRGGQRVRRLAGADQAGSEHVTVLRALSPPGALGVLSGQGRKGWGDEGPAGSWCDLDPCDTGRRPRRSGLKRSRLAAGGAAHTVPAWREAGGPAPAPLQNRFRIQDAGASQIGKKGGRCRVYGAALLIRALEHPGMRSTWDKRQRTGLASCSPRGHADTRRRGHARKGSPAENFRVLEAGLAGDEVGPAGSRRVGTGQGL